MREMMWFEHRVMLDGVNVFDYENDERADRIIDYLSTYESPRGFRPPTVIRRDNCWVSVNLDDTHFFRIVLCTRVIVTGKQ